MTDDIAEPGAFSRPLSDGDLRAARRGLTISGEATPQERAAIAAEHDLQALDSMSFEARLEPFQSDGWRLSGRVRAEAAQKCVVTLEPVPALVDASFERLWSPQADESAGDVEAAGGQVALFDAEAGPMSADAWRAAETGEEPPEIERTPETIDPGAVALETFTLALDPYPRREGAAFQGATHGPPDAEPLTDEAARPFASLEALKARMETESQAAEGAEAEPGSKDEWEADGGAEKA